MNKQNQIPSQCKTCISKCYRKDLTVCSLYDLRLALNNFYKQLLIIGRFISETEEIKCNDYMNESDLLKEN